VAGLAPFFFVATPEEESADIKVAAKGMEYWSQVPVVARIGDSEFTTALFPKDGSYLLPVKDVVRRSAVIEVDQVVAVAFERRTPVDGRGVGVRSGAAAAV
jgi:hypothetical protein